MEVQRKQRYRQKINFVTEKIIDIPKKIQTNIEIDATLYRVQIAIEGCMDIVAMLAKDKGKDVSDDYNNIHTLEKIEVIDSKIAGNLIKLNGLRNAIVHKYNTFEESTVIKNIKNIQSTIIKLLERVENEIKNKS